MQLCQQSLERALNLRSHGRTSTRGGTRSKKPELTLHSAWRIKNSWLRKRYNAAAAAAAARAGFSAQAAAAAAAASAALPPPPNINWRAATSRPSPLDAAAAAAAGVSADPPAKPDRDFFRPEWHRSAMWEYFEQDESTLPWDFRPQDFRPSPAAAAIPGAGAGAGGNAGRAFSTEGFAKGSFEGEPGAEDDSAAVALLLQSDEDVDRVVVSGFGAQRQNPFC